MKRFLALALALVMILGVTPMMNKGGFNPGVVASAADARTIIVGKSSVVTCSTGTVGDWKINDVTIAKIIKSGNSCTITAVKEGTATVTAYDSEGKVLESFGIIVKESEECTITFDANGGTVSPASKKFKSGEAVEIPVPQRSGYNCIGWGISPTSTALKYGSGTVVYPTESMTLYAIWKANKVVTFDANGGTVSPTSATVEGAVTLPKPTRSGYTCVGWATSKSASEAQYACGSAFRPSKDMTLYAVWKANYKITFDPMGGTVTPTSKEINYGDKCSLPTPLRDGYSCDGWAKTKGASKADYVCGTKFTPSGSMTLYAVWSEKDHKVKFNAMGGSVSPENKKVSAGKSVALPTPEKNGYTCVGWTDDSKATAEKYACGSNYNPDRDITLYAVWKANGLIKLNGGWGYYVNNKLDTSFTGLAKNAYGWWYVKAGRIDYTYTGMAKNAYGWWYVKNGKLDQTYTGMAKNAYGWWYMKNGKIDTSYNGKATNQYGTWNVVNGKVTTRATTTSTAKTSSGTTQSGTVYVTKTGKKYHNAGCKHLSSSSYTISLSNAKAQGYEPCNDCH